MSRRRDALRAMASQDVSPHERDIARAKLEAIGDGADEPPSRPPATSAPGWDWVGRSDVTVSSVGGTVWVNITIRSDVG